jgi:hypothetical protein
LAEFNGKFTRYKMIISGVTLSGIIVIEGTPLPSSCNIEGDLELQTGTVDLDEGFCVEDLNSD